MGFTKGNNYGKGRPKNSPNKTTAQVKEIISKVTDELEKTLFNDISELQATDRVKLWLSLQEYLAPKLSRQQTENNNLTIEVGAPSPDYSKLSLEELKFLKVIAEKIENS
jgi:hypothetical protein